MSKTITLNEALAKIKLLNKKIADKTNKLKLTSYAPKNSETEKKSNKLKKDFIEKGKSDLQEIQDLIKNIKEIKDKLVIANATNYVTVAGVTYTIAEAIERKNSIGREIDLLQHISTDYHADKRYVEGINQQNQTRLDTRINTLLGNSDRKDCKDLIDAITENAKKEEFEVVNESIVSDLIDKMQEEINDFISNVDVQLTIANSTVTIEIDD